MRRIILAAALLASSSLGGAQEAPSIINPIPPQTAGACGAPNTVYEVVSTGTAVSSGTANSKGSWTLLGAVGGSSYSGFWLSFVPTSGRQLVDVAIGQGTSIIVENFYTMGAASARAFFPIAVPANSNLYVRTQSSSSSQNGVANLTGQVSQAGCFAGFSKAEALNPDLAVTRAGNVEVPLSNAGWVELVASTSRNYSALMLSGGGGNNTPGTAQSVSFTLGLGASGSETIVGSASAWNIANSAGVVASGGPIFTLPTAGGTRLSARATAAVPGTDAIRVQVMGIY